LKILPPIGNQRTMNDANKSINPIQCRAARGILGWSQSDLASRAGVSTPTVSVFETGKRETHANNLAAIRRAFEDAGVELLAPTERRGPGVSLREPG
jgi:transcriptional regulator with XRE-family HTH domain